MGRKFRFYVFEGGNMQTDKLIAENKIFGQKRLVRDAVVSVPFSSDVKNVCAKTAFNAEVDIAPCFPAPNALVQIWNEQHPIIHTWLLLSSISICFLFAVFFIIQ